jgi:hypothetical protein
MAKPDFDLMWAVYPDHMKYPSLAVLFNSIGGQLARNVSVPGFEPNGNTCAVRMSRALNYGTLPIAASQVKALKLSTLKGADDLLYLYRVREMVTYLGSALGVTPKSVSKDFASAFSGSRGIVAFTVEGWGDAGGHMALWDGSAFREPDHDDYRLLQDDPTTPKREARTTRMTLWAL